MKSVILVLSIIGVRYFEAEKVEPVYESLLSVINSVYEFWRQREQMAEWDLASNMTEATRRRKVAVSAEAAKFYKIIWKSVKNLNWKNFSNDHLRRQFKLYSIIERSALENEDFKRFTSITTQMASIYSTAKVCVDEGTKNCKKLTISELWSYLGNSDNPSQHARLWSKWSDTIGPQIKPLYTEYVELSNKAARLNGFKDTSEMWLQGYEDEPFLSHIEELWLQVKPLFMEMHACRRWQLRNKFEEIVSEKGPIPIHMFGIRDRESKSAEQNLTADFNNELVKQHYTAKKMFETAEEFFTSINMSAMPETFWSGSILQKPKDREMECMSASADFYDGVNFRIKQCTDLSFYHFYTAHHEMGHIQYFMQYKDQPIQFREGANPGFHEAIGDTISLSVKTTTHLRNMGLLNIPDHEEVLMNNLLDTAFEKGGVLPFGYSLELWRWKVFKGEIKPENYNCKWWELMEEYQGIEPPVERSEEDFDPAIVFHIIRDVPYIRYFVAAILQFQFHKALCIKAGQYNPEDSDKPLHKCDIYGSAEAGNALKKMLAMGSSKPWPDALEVLTGERNMNASALLEYFQPLYDWLRLENIKNNASVGWEKSNKVCSSKKVVSSTRLLNNLPLNSTLPQRSTTRLDTTMPKSDVMPQRSTTPQTRTELLNSTTPQRNISPLPNISPQYSTNITPLRSTTTPQSSNMTLNSIKPQSSTTPMPWPSDAILTSTISVTITTAMPLRTISQNITTSKHKITLPSTIPPNQGAMTAGTVRRKSG